LTLQKPWSHGVVLTGLSKTIAVLAGDGIGPEVMAETVKVAILTGAQDGRTGDFEVSPYSLYWDSSGMILNIDV